MQKAAKLWSTGLPGFDTVIKEALPGDNIVWYVDSLDDFVPFVKPYCRHAIDSGQKLIYFRFAKHPPLVEPDMGAEIYHLQAEGGFEKFVSDIHRVIDEHGKGNYYVFDCLSELVLDWFSDRMLGNFFKLVCPYLYDAKTLTIFAVLKNHHSFHAITPILETAQVVSHVYRHHGTLYVHPVKVEGRYSPTMNMIHEWSGDDFIPVTESAVITEIMSHAPWSNVDGMNTSQGIWYKTFSEAEKIEQGFREGLIGYDEVVHYFQRLIRMIFSREIRMIRLAQKYLTLSDLLKIWKRMIGTGLIGGKAVGMIVARAILQKSDKRFRVLLEPHDSFFIGSDVFYTFLVNNKVWWLRKKIQEAPDFHEGAQDAAELILRGQFPGYIEKQFMDMLDYFGQSPVIVRSSSLLEDNFGNAFAGKYKSIFLANQGTRQERLTKLINAVREIYASTMSEEALSYRAMRGLMQQDEQMALLVQRVSGARHQGMFFPQSAGVGFSFNPYAWSEYIDPEAGMLRLVFGLGTRAVDRSDDDYTRIVALNDVQRRPETSFEQVRRYAQRKVDLINMDVDALVTKQFEEIVKSVDDLPIDFYATQDKEMEKRAADRGIKNVFSYALTFEKLLKQTNFAEDMRQALAILQDVYTSPVDVEFTLNFFNHSEYRINLVQCRPLQLKGGGAIVDPTDSMDNAHIAISASGPVIGQSRIIEIDTIIYVIPEIYSQLPIQQRYSVARKVGQLAHQFAPNQDDAAVMLIGPGRWGTSSPSLGVPVSYQEINTVSVIIEMTGMSKDISPDVSLGTHFFSDLIENDTLYLGFLSHRSENHINHEFFQDPKFRHVEPYPSDPWLDAIRVIRHDPKSECDTMKLYANALKQRFACYFEHTD